MSRHVLVCAFVIASGWSTLTSAELSSPGSKDAHVTCVGDCPTIETDCKEECGCDERIPSTYDNRTNNCVINITLFMLSLNAKFDTENKDMSTEGNVDDVATAELSSPASKEANVTCVGDCPTVNTDCKEKCGCDKRITSTYNNETNDCVINMRLLILSLKEKYNTEDKDMSTEGNVDDMTSRLRAEADRVFKGVIVAAFLFIACASVCTLTACFYCCWINYTDHQLKKSIKVLAKKMGNKYQKKKRTDKEPTAPMAESCNVVVEDAGVFCV